MVLYKESAQSSFTILSPKCQECVEMGVAFSNQISNFVVRDEGIINI